MWAMKGLAGERIRVLTGASDGWRTQWRAGLDSGSLSLKQLPDLFLGFRYRVVIVPHGSS